jgi:predicted aconitase with swiveling domain
MKTSGVRHSGRALVAGRAAGTALVLESPLSYAGGIDRTSGRIEDIRSPYLGASVTSRIVVMPIGRGSSSASATLAEAIRLGTAPRAIVLSGVDQILTIGAIVARLLYGKVCPVLVVDERDFKEIKSGDRVAIFKDGTFEVEPKPPKVGDAHAASRRGSTGNLAGPHRSTSKGKPDSPMGAKLDPRSDQPSEDRPGGPDRADRRRN